MRHTALPVPRFLAVVLLAALTAPLSPAAAEQSAQEQIASAVLAAPEDRRDEAAVVGWVDGAAVTLREGDNDLVCLADDPGQDGFSVACYHESLEPFMARGRELTAQGVTGAERRDRRLAEVESGELPMPREPRMLYVLSGDGYDAAAGEVTNGSLRWSIYMPFATAESTGFSTTPKRGEPWLMGAGTAGAHLMITPPE